MVTAAGLLVGSTVLAVSPPSWVQAALGLAPAFALTFWELDRGGPVVRTQAERTALPAADFRFSQDENDDAVHEVAATASGRRDWVPTLMDYLYVSVTKSTAFSPTDTMPLSPRANC
jgi:hypothetical protein